MKIRSAMWLATAVFAIGSFAVGCGKHDDAPAKTAKVVSQPAAPAPAAKGAAWEAFLHDFIEDTFRARPTFAVSQGRHEFDGKLPDWSPAALASEVERLRTALRAAEKFDGADLTPDQAFERDYMIAYLQGQLFWREEVDEVHKSPFFYSTAFDPEVYLTREYAPLAQRMRAYTDMAAAVPKALAQMKSNLQPPLARTYVKVSHGIFSGMADFYSNDVPAIFASVEDKDLQSRFAVANSAAAGALRDMADWLEAQLPTADDSFRLGPERFARMIAATERVTTPLAELKKIGEADLDRNLAALGEACTKLAPGKSLEQCVAQVQAQKPADGAVAGAREQLAGLKQFLIDKEIVTIPGTEEARVEEAPPYNRWNAAYINIPGPYETGLPSTYYIAPPDPTWSEADRLAYTPGDTDLLFISVHEVWPGHFLNFLHANRAPSKFGQMFVGYAFSEGWAHYTEEMMWDAGLGEGDPATHVGQLLNALLRDVRYLSAIGMHTENMTVEESEAMFREKAFQDPGNARQQAARGTFDPAYLNYTMGKLMIRKLRDDWTASRGGRKAWQQFHDRFLSFGGPPVPLVRAAMLAGDPAASASLF